MSTDRRNRVPKGVPTGGEFAEEQRTEPQSAALGGFFAEAGFDDVDETVDLPEATAQPGEQMRGNVYRFPRHLLNQAIESVDTANRRLEREGIDERFTYELTETPGARPPTEQEVRFGHPVGSRIDATEVTMRLNRPAISHDGWTFAAKVDALPGTDETITSAIPGTDFSGRRFDVDACEHCGTTRHRQSSYILTDSQGQTKQVGSHCVEAFFGVKPAGLWALGAEVDIDEKYDDEGHRMTGPQRVWTPEEALSHALDITGGGRGYVSRSKADEYGDLSTADDVETALWNDYDPSNAQTYIEDGTVAEVIAAARRVGTNTDYGANLNAILDSGVVRRRDLGILTSALGAYRRQQAADRRAAIDEKYPQVPGYLGEVKQRLRQVRGAIISTTHHSATYNGHERSSTFVTMRTSTGHNAVWKASKYLSFEPGQEITFDATVKEHSQYRGEDQTVFTRATITSE